MLGAIFGDFVGSKYEFNNIKTTDFELIDDDMSITDDSILTIAVADWLLQGMLSKERLISIVKDYVERYPNPAGGYGISFNRWAKSNDNEPYNSWGNGSAMRVAAVGWAFDTLEQTEEIAKLTAEITHNHPEGIKGAQAVAAAIFMARTGKTKDEIEEYVTDKYDYDLSRTCDDIRPTYCFNESCQGTVPEAIIAFLDSNDFESAIRLAISLGGDSDTLTCITGGIAEAFYGMDFRNELFARLPFDLLRITKEFCKKYIDADVNDDAKFLEVAKEYILQKIGSKYDVVTHLFTNSNGLRIYTYECVGLYGKNKEGGARKVGPRSFIEIDRKGHVYEVWDYCKRRSYFRKKWNCDSIELNLAIVLAKEAHSGQVDKSGQPYINHPMRVMEMGETEEEKIVGVLHDVVEDSSWTFEKLWFEGFSKNIIDALKCVTKISDDEPYDDFIKRVAQNPIATKVKMNDLKDNMDITRLKEMGDRDVAKLRKYLRAYKYLNSL